MLHHATAAPLEEQIALMRLLIVQRADVNVADQQGIGPLHLAAMRGSKHVIRTLLCARADNQQRTKDGRSTVDFAALSPSPVEAFEVLGWPGQGPRERPLERPEPKALAQEAQAEEVPQWSELAFPLLLLLAWFALLAASLGWVGSLEACSVAIACRGYPLASSSISETALAREKMQAFHSCACKCCQPPRLSSGGERGRHNALAGPKVGVEPGWLPP